MREGQGVVVRVCAFLCVTLICRVSLDFYSR